MIFGMSLHFHFPIHFEWDGSHRGSIHLHGHCHGKRTGMEKYRVCDVGVDTNELKPYLLDSLVQRLSLNSVAMDISTEVV